MTNGPEKSVLDVRIIRRFVHTYIISTAINRSAIMLLPRSARRCVNYVNNLLAEDSKFESSGSEVLFIAFAGMAGILKTAAKLGQRLGIETRPFEFVHSLQDKNCDVLFLRDRHRAYYHLGVKGLGDDIDEVADVLNQTISERKYRLVVTLGHSMGGYAALLFASRIRVDVCIAVSPRTFLDPENRARYGDGRFREEIDRLYRSQLNTTSTYYDLRRYFLSGDSRLYENSCKYFVFFGGSDRLDRIHASRMAGLNRSFSIYEVKNAGHNAARQMRDSGLLSRVVDSVLSYNDRRNPDELFQSISSDNSVRNVLTRSRALPI